MTVNTNTPLISLADRIAVLPGIRWALDAMTRHKLTVFLLQRAANEPSGVNGYALDELFAFTDRLRDSGAVIASLEDIIELQGSGRQPEAPIVAFTADGGYRDQATVLGRAFADHGLPLTVFLITDFVDRKLWSWDARIAYAFANTEKRIVRIPIGRLELDFSLEGDLQKKLACREFQLIAKLFGPEQLDALIGRLAEALEVSIPPEPPPAFEPMTWSDARELEALGIRFASHTRTHRVLTTLSEQAVLDELTKSRESLRRELRSPVNAVAWPVGQLNDFGQRECRIAEELGFAAAFSTCDGYTSVAGVSPMPIFARFGFSIEDGSEYSFRRARGIRRAIKPVWSPSTRMPKLTDASVFRGTRNVPDRRGSRRVRLLAAVASVRAALGRYRKPSSEQLADVRRLVFVCSGNICRSPYAEAVARSLVDVRVVSCGLAANGVATADPTAARVAAARGVDLTKHVSRNLDAIELRKDDLILVMEPSHIEQIRTRCVEDGMLVSLLGLWLPRPSAWLPDPYDLGIAEFVEVFDNIDLAVKALSEQLSLNRTSDQGA